MQFGQLIRREVIALLGGAAAWPLAARAQQPAMPVVGFLGTTSMAANAPSVAAFRRGLKENGYVEGQNVTIEFRWGEGQLDRLQGLAADLVGRPVAVMFGGGPPAALAAKAATMKIPVVFTSGADPVKIGLVSSLNRPGANVTGISILFREVEAKRLELLRELIPTARAVGLVFDHIASSEEAETAARRLGLGFHAVPVATEDQLDAAFSSLADHRVDMVLVGSSPRIGSWHQRIIRLAARTSLPAIYELRQYVTDGGLISYGASVTDAYRQAGTYVARILKGEKPSDLPVVQPTKFELVINLKTAKALGLDVPPMLLARADEVIE
jgi:putative tryptophan/tyrosine transport system substrate-binding protein